MPVVIPSLNFSRRELLWYLGTAGVIALFTGLGFFIVWFATAPDDGRSIWPSFSLTVTEPSRQPVAAVKEESQLSAAEIEALEANVPVYSLAPRLLKREQHAAAILKEHKKLPAGEMRLPMGVHNSLGMLMTPLAAYADGRVIWVCMHETRLGDYETFIEKGGYTMMGELASAWREIGKTMAASSSQRRESNSGVDHPVSYLCADDSIAFCRWLTQYEREQGRLGKKNRYRLPTDAEWSLAANLPEVQDVLNLAHRPPVPEYYWGDDFPPVWTVGNLGLMTDGYAATAPVMQFTPNKLGLYDISGNVSELCVLSPGLYVRRGASWCTDRQSELKTSYRELCASHSRAIGAGFRCVLEQREVISE